MVSVLIVMISGCSFGLTGADPARATHVAPRCDESKGLVVVDWVLAGVGATAALSALSANEEQGAGLLALASVAFIASAVRGNGVVNECREQFAEYASASREAPEVAAKPRRFDDPYGSPPDLPARRIVAPAPVAAVPAPVAPPATKRAAKPAPAPEPAADEDWADFWTEVP